MVPFVAISHTCSFSALKKERVEEVLETEGFVTKIEIYEMKELKRNVTYSFLFKLFN